MQRSLGPNTVELHTSSQLLFQLMHDKITLFLYITVIWSFLSLPAESTPRPKMTQCIAVHENQIHDSNQLGKERRAWNRESISGVSLNAETTQVWFRKIQVIHFPSFYNNRNQQLPTNYKIQLWLEGKYTCQTGKVQGPFVQLINFSQRTEVSQPHPRDPRRITDAALLIRIPF